MQFLLDNKTSFTSENSVTKTLNETIIIEFSGNEVKQDKIGTNNLTLKLVLVCFYSTAPLILASFLKISSSNTVYSRKRTNLPNHFSLFIRGLFVGSIYEIKKWRIISRHCPFKNITKLLNVYSIWIVSYCTLGMFGHFNFNFNP